jgi:hypothetical protein
MRQLSREDTDHLLDAGGTPLQEQQIVRIKAGRARHLGVVTKVESKKVVVRWGPKLERVTRYRADQLTVLELRQLKNPSEVSEQTDD